MVRVAFRAPVERQHVLGDAQVETHEHDVGRNPRTELGMRILMPASDEFGLLRRHPRPMLLGHTGRLAAASWMLSISTDDRMNPPSGPCSSSLTGRSTHSRRLAPTTEPVSGSSSVGRKARRLLPVEERNGLVPA